MCLRKPVTGLVRMLGLSGKKNCLFNKMLIASFHVFTSVAALDKIEDALGKFNDGPFFLGQFSLVCVAEHYESFSPVPGARFKIISTILHYECGLQLACGFVVMRFFFHYYTNRWTLLMYRSSRGFRYSIPI